MTRLSTTSRPSHRRNGLFLSLSASLFFGQYHKSYTGIHHDDTERLIPDGLMTHSHGGTCYFTHGLVIRYFLSWLRPFGLHIRGLDLANGCAGLGPCAKFFLCLHLRGFRSLVTWLLFFYSLISRKLVLLTRDQLGDRVWNSLSCSFLGVWLASDLAWL